MNTRAKNIVYNAWEIVKKERHLIKFGFWPSFFVLIVSGAYIFYQIQAFMHSPLFSSKHINYTKIFSIVLDFAKSNQGISIAFIITAILVLIAYFFLPIICEGALVHLISNIYHGKESKHGLSTGIFRFLPLFETNVVKGTMKPTSFFTEWSFVIRNLGPGRAWLLTPFLIFFLLIGVVMLFFFAFTSQFIVLEKDSFALSIKNSIKMVIRNIGTTFSLFLIFILIELRVILNIAVILFIPIAVIFISGIFNTLLSMETVAIIIAGIVVLILLVLTAYITGTLSVFANAIWTLAYLEFKKEEQEDEIVKTPPSQAEEDQESPDSPEQAINPSPNTNPDPNNPISANNF